MLILIRRSTCMRSYLHLYILVTYLKHNGMPPPDYRYFLFPLFYFLSVSFFYFSIPVSTLFLLLKRFSHLWLCVQANLAGEPLREAAVSKQIPSQLSRRFLSTLVPSQPVKGGIFSLYSVKMYSFFL